MTSQQDQIQRLIDEIDAVLTKANPRLPWVMSGEASQQRQVLEKTRSYLQSVQQGITVAGGWTQAAAPPTEAAATGSEAAAQQVLQSLLQEMEYLRANMLQPMRIEVDALQQERQALLSEVAELRQLRAAPAAAPEPSSLDAQELQGFLEGLMTQLQERLSQQVVDTLSQLEANGDNQLLLQQAAAADGDDLELLSPSQRLAQMRLIQSQTDQLLLQMDGTLGMVFGALEKTIQSYQTSLSQGLDNMHGLGQQGEVIFKALINHLAQQLSQEASAFLESGVLREAARAQLLASTQAEQTWDEAIDDLTADFDDFDEFDDQPTSAWESAPEVTQIQTNSADESDPDAGASLSGLDDLALEDLDLDDDVLGDDIEIDFDDEITQLQVDDSLDQDGDDERTVIQEYRGPAGDPLELLSRWNEADQAIADALAANRTPPPSAVADQDQPAVANDGYPELDDFYQSLFGDGAIAPNAADLDAADLDAADLDAADLDAVEDEEPPPEDSPVEPTIAEPPLDLAPEVWAEEDTADNLETVIEEGADSLSFLDGLALDDSEAETETETDLATDLAPEGNEDSDAAAPQGLDDLSDLEDFGGFGDFEEFEDIDPDDDDETELLAVPLPRQPDSPDPATDFPDPAPGSEPRSDLPTLDSLLFGDSDLPEDGTASQESPTLGTLFSNEPDENVAAELSAAPAADTITSLANLFPEDQIGQTTTNVDLFEPDLATDLNAPTWSDDAYIPAPSEEDLLISEDDSPEETILDFDVDSGTLQQLSTDLSSLEGIELENFDNFDLLSTPEGAPPPPADNFPNPPLDSAEAVYTDYPSEPDISSSDQSNSDLFGPDLALDLDPDRSEPDLPNVESDSDLADPDLANPDLSEPKVSNSEPFGLDLFGSEPFGSELSAPSTSESTPPELDRFESPAPTGPEPTEDTQDLFGDQTEDTQDLFGDQFEDELAAEDSEDNTEQTLDSLVTELGMETASPESARTGSAETDTAWTRLETAQTQEMPEAEVAQALFSDRLTTGLGQSPDSDPASGDRSPAAPLNEGEEDESEEDESVEAMDALALFADLPGDSEADPDALASDDLIGTGIDGTLDGFGDDFGLDLDLDVPPPAPSSDSIETISEQWEISGDENSATTLDNLGLGDLAEALGRSDETSTKPETPESDALFSLESLAELDLDDSRLDLPSTPLEALGDAVNLVSEFSPMPPLPNWGSTPTVDPADSDDDLFGEAFEADLADPLKAQPFGDDGSSDDGSSDDGANTWTSDDADSGLAPDLTSAFADDWGADLDSLADGAADADADLTADLGDDLFASSADPEAGEDFFASNADPETTVGLEDWEDSSEAAPPKLADDADNLEADDAEIDDLENLVESFAESFSDFEDTPSAESLGESFREDRAEDGDSDLGANLGLDLDSFDFGAPAPSASASEADDVLEALTPPPDISTSDFEAFLGTDDRADDLGTPDPSPSALSESPEIESPDDESPKNAPSLEDAPPLDLGAAGIGEETASQEIDLSNLGPLVEMSTDPEREGAPLADDADGELEFGELELGGPDPNAPNLDNPEVSGLELEGLDLGELNLDSLDLDAPDDAPDADSPVADPLVLGLEASAPTLKMPDLDQPPPAESEPVEGVPQLWTLGLDLGTTGISVVLMERYSGDAYPLYWQRNEVGAPQMFRFPTQADLNLAAATVGAVGGSGEPNSLDGADGKPLRLHSLKPLLSLGVPHVSASSGQWQPQVQWSDDQAVPLNLVQESLRQLLQSVWPGQGNSWVCAAPKLSPEQVQDILQRLHSVVVGYPVNWPDTYSFNIREAVLGAGLVKQSEQIFFVEDSIAALLSVLPDPATATEDPAALTARQSTTLYCYPWQGGTVVINAGAHLTELAVADLPADLGQLNRSDFVLRSFAYGGDGIDQDIICQLIAPAAARKLSGDRSPKPHWQIEVDDFDAAWAALGLETLDLPRPSEPDSAKRCQLQQRLMASSLGQSLLQAARHLKVQLQGRQQGQFVLEVGPYQWLIQRKALEGQVFMPFIRRLNRHLNGLLSQTRLSPQGVKQVVSTGGAASLSAIARLLKDKFPNATTIYDTYAGDQARCSRVAYGLANLVRYPQVLDLVRQQYSDYFLLRELLRVFPDQPMPITGVMHLLEQQGINTQACQNHLLALLDGHLPPGLVPGNGEAPILSAVTQTDPLYVSLRSQPLFTKQASQIIVPNLEQCQRLRAYFGQLLHNKVQTLEEPLIGQLVPVLEG